MTRLDAPRVACPKCDSQLLRVLLRTTQLQYCRCEDCAEVFAVPAPQRESHWLPERRTQR